MAGRYIAGPSGLIVPNQHGRWISGAGGWSDEAGLQSNLHQVVDETTSGDSDFIRSPANPTGNPYQGFGMASPLDDTADYGALVSAEADCRFSIGTVEGGSGGSGDDSHSLLVQLTTYPGIYAADGTYQSRFRLGANSDVWFSGAGGRNVALESKTFINDSDNNAGSQLWSARPIEVLITATQNTSMGADGHRVWVDLVRLKNIIYQPGELVANSWSTIDTRLNSDDGNVISLADNTSVTTTYDMNPDLLPAGFGNWTDEMRFTIKWTPVRSGDDVLSMQVSIVAADGSTVLAGFMDASPASGGSLPFQATAYNVQNTHIGVVRYIRPNVSRADWQSAKLYVIQNYQSTPPNDATCHIDLNQITFGGYFQREKAIRQVFLPSLEAVRRASRW